MSTPCLQVIQISKAFPGVQALEEVSLELHAGEVVALMGANGAGKSTLIRLLAGATQCDGGAIWMDGQPVQLADPATALRAGIGVIHQEFFLVPQLSVLDNLFLGHHRPLGMISRRQESQSAREVFQRLGISIDLEAICGQLSVAEQQMVEVAKCLLRRVRVLVLDEPTAALTPRESQRLLDFLRTLRAEGLAILYVSHRLEEVFQIADRIAVLRDGRMVAQGAASGWQRKPLIEAMVGRPLESEYPKEPAVIGNVVLRCRQLGRGNRVQDVSLELHEGEILGVAGLVGAGRTELARLLFGLDRHQTGSIELDGRPISLRGPKDAMRLGIGFLPEDRKKQGLILDHGLIENFSLPNLASFSRGGWMRRSEERQAYDQQQTALGWKPSAPRTPAKLLSGGNQQKLVLGKWIQRDPRVLILDEPTRGVDVGARVDVYRWIVRLAQSHCAILWISSDFEELIGMSDRIVVMHRGRIVSEILDPQEVSASDLLSAAVGADRGDRDG
ncbi:MAG: sugar ABC transporter ATP-binding protein [Pirellulaceae bacterium]